MVGGALYQPAAFLVPSTVAVTVGGVVSMLIGPKWPGAQLPAGSHDDAEVPIWLAPSALTTVAGVVVGVPEEGVGSVAAQVIVTGPVYQPLWSGFRSAAPVTVGAVVSSWTGGDGSDEPAPLIATTVKW